MVRRKRCLTVRTERLKKREKERRRRLTRRLKREKDLLAVEKCLSVEFIQRPPEAGCSGDVPKSHSYGRVIVCSTTGKPPPEGTMDDDRSASGSPAFNKPGTPNQSVYDPVTAAAAQYRQPSQSKYSQLLAVIEDMGRDIRPTYSGSKSSAERLKRGIGHARILVRECLIETERSAKS